ncbi:MAG: hypothetical protein WHU54_09630 [Candidatus Bathyarchaeia archaeon]
MRIPNYLKQRIESLKLDASEPLWRVIERALDGVNDASRKSSRTGSQKKTRPVENAAELWDAWSNAYRHRYGVEYPRNAKVNAQLKSIKDRIGQNAADVIKFYLMSNDAWLLKTKHDLGSLAKNPETWLVRWQAGQHTISDRLAREAEKAATADEEMRVAMEKVERIFSFFDEGRKK